MEKYLKDYHHEDITNLLNNSNDSVHVSININLTVLKNTNYLLFKAIKTNAHKEIGKWSAALLNAQKNLIEGNMFLDPDFQIKENCHVRFVNLPFNKVSTKKRGTFPNNLQRGQFVQIVGNVVRMTQARLLETKRDYVCRHCKKVISVDADYTNMYTIDPPKRCPNLCKGYPAAKSTEPNLKYCIDYQEIRVQEVITDKNIPTSLIVTLEDDLVHLCQPGDYVTICGTVELRWKVPIPEKESNISLTIRAVSVIRQEKCIVIDNNLPENLLCFRAEWQDSVDRYGELEMRDLIIKSLCPEVYGMYLVKLAVALTMCSNIEAKQLSSGSTLRGNSHLLLVGDPGLAKSKLLKFASSVLTRSIHTTGMGCSAAGLTASVVKEGGDTQLEAGALVLADGGICCVDEFTLMRENDRTNIHEAMEQQTISIAKAGIICKLRTRCAVLAATNPKRSMNERTGDGMSSLNIGIDGPLLSRFDMILWVRDEYNINWDNDVADHILNFSKEEEQEKPLELWSLEKMQTHFINILDINSEMTPEANRILSTYYKMCRASEFRDASRTTTRFLDSLVRLAHAHARLVVRDKVTYIDAVVVVRLMESSWGFGNIVKPLDILKKSPPLGPNDDEVQEVLNALNLTNLITKSSGETRHKYVNLHKLRVNSNVTKNKEHDNCNELSNRSVILNESSIDQTSPKLNISCVLNETTQSFNNINHINENTQKSTDFLEEIGNADNFDEILSFDDYLVSNNKFNKNSDNGKKSKKRKPDNDSIFYIPGLSDNFDLDEFEYKKTKMIEKSKSSRKAIAFDRRKETKRIEVQAIVHRSLNSQEIGDQSEDIAEKLKIDLQPSNACNSKLDNSISCNVEKGTISNSVINRLKQFENSKFEDKSCDNRNGNQNKDNDSAYETIAISSNERFKCKNDKSQSSCTILASQNQDLRCMDDLDF